MHAVLRRIGMAIGTKRNFKGETQDAQYVESAPLLSRRKTIGYFLSRNEPTCRAGDKGDDSLVKSAGKAGFDCGYGGTKPNKYALHSASKQALAGLKRAEKRVLTYVAGLPLVKTVGLRLSRRAIVVTCHITERDVPLNLKRLAARGLLRIRANNYAAKRRTQVAFLVDRADLSERLGNADNSPSENDTTPSENSRKRAQKVTPPPLKNDTTMERELYVT